MYRTKTYVECNMSCFKIDNAIELWHINNVVPAIPTFSRSLDSILGNGIQLGSLTELIGLPGTGKTQLCLQLCASIQVPKALGGFDADALYIDTNTNFSMSRLRQILNATLQKCEELVPFSFKFYEDIALEKIRYVQTIGFEEFCAFMHTLPAYLTARPNIKLVVIDSIVFPFKEGISAKDRTGLLFRLMAKLQRVAVTNQIAVVLTNEMSTRIGLSGGSIVAALGDAWAHRCNKRVLLSTEPDPSIRLALLLKSNDSPRAVAKFQITKAGIRDVDKKEAQNVEQ